MLDCESDRSYGRLICKILLPDSEDVCLDQVKPEWPGTTSSIRTSVLQTEIRLRRMRRDARQDRPMERSTPCSAARFLAWNEFTTAVGHEEMPYEQRAN
jgi:hypothetical protein